MPGPPLGILVKSSLPSIFWSAKQNGQWSVETTCRWSCLRPSQSLGWCSLGRSGGVKTYLAPSKFGPRQFVDGEQQVLRAGLGEGRHAAVARLAHLVERVFRREVHDVDRHAGDLRHGDGAVHGLGLGARRARERVIDGRGLSLGQRARDDHVDHAAVFGVHADQRAVLGGLRERLENGGVVHHQDVGIGHEQLEAGHALVAPCRPCLPGRRRPGR